MHLIAGGGNTSGVFVGIGRSDDVDRCLAGVPIDQVTAQVQIVVPNAFPLSVAALTVSVLIIGSGIVVLVIAFRRERRQTGCLA